MTIAPVVRKVIEETISESMAVYGLRDINIHSGTDHDGDPVLFIEAAYDLTDTPVDPAITASLTSKLRDRLWEHGETRFPHIRHKFDEAQRVIRRRRRMGA